MKLKASIMQDLYDTMVDYFVEEIQDVGCGDGVERLEEIIAEDYPNWSDEKCKTVAQQFFDEHYGDAFTEAQETFEPSPRDEALADIRAGRL